MSANKSTLPQSSFVYKKGTPVKSVSKRVKKSTKLRAKFPIAR